MEQGRYVWFGFLEGFHIPFVGERRPYMAPNLPSVRGMEAVVRQKIAKECKEGSVLGPFAEPPLPDLRVSPLGVVPKKAPGDYRLIHHLSYPKGASVNDAIPGDLCSVRYTSFDQALGMVRRCGWAAELAKCDIKSAFRLLPVHPGDFNLLGFAFEGGFYVDRALPMGCSVSCAAFEAFSTFLEWVVHDRSGLKSTAHYLDDFLFAGQQGSGQRAFLLEQFMQLTSELGVPLAHEKTEGPVTKLTFLGIEIDTVREVCCLPQDKLDKLRSLIGSALGKRKVTLLALQQIAGHLNFACKVAPGRPFVRRFCDAMAGLKAPHHKTRVTVGMREDLLMWREFLGTFNGVSFWRDDLLLEAELQVMSDAAGSSGFGVYFRKHWCAADWPRAWVQAGWVRDLTFLEFFPIVVAVRVWGTEMANSVVHFWCDNLAAVHVINSLTSRSPRVMALVRAFTLLCLQHNILFRARHVPGVNNGIADALSRKQMARFRHLAPEADSCPVPVPGDMRKIGGLKPTGLSDWP